VSTLRQEIIIVKRPGLFLLACLTILPWTTVYGHGSLPDVPPDYPSHKAAGECTDPDRLLQLQQRLTRYNMTRLAIAEVLRKMADKYALQGETRNGLLAFAVNFEDMQRHLPAPDPDSDTFRNFDFRLGLTFTALMVYLNTRDEILTRHFYDDRDNPASDLGIYLASLDASRESYLSSLGTSDRQQGAATVPCP
jgi:hypothetical protein